MSIFIETLNVCIINDSGPVMPPSFAGEYQHSFVNKINSIFSSSVVIFIAPSCLPVIQPL